MSKHRHVNMMNLILDVRERVDGVLDFLSEKYDRDEVYNFQPASDVQRIALKGLCSMMEIEVEDAIKEVIPTWTKKQMVQEDEYGELTQNRMLNYTEAMRVIRYWNESARMKFKRGD